MTADRYHEDVRAQPQALRKVLDYYRTSDGRDLLQHAAATLSRGPRHLWLTGMGASLFACLAARNRLDEGGFSYRVEETAYLAEHGYANRRTAGGLVLVSQSGETIEAKRLATHDGFDVPTVLLSGGSSGELVDRSDVVLPLVVEPDYSVAIKTYTASTLVLQLLFAKLSGQDLDKLSRAAEMSLDAMELYLDQRDPIGSAVVELVSEADNLYALGRGPSLGSACETGLLFKETSKRSCEGMGSAQFRHGAIEVVEPNVLCVVFSGCEERSRRYHRRLVEEIHSYGGSTLVVGAESGAAEVGGPAITIPEVHPTTMPLLEVVPIQLLVSSLAQARGVEPGSFRNTVPVITTD